MKPKMMLKILIDVAMTVSLLFLMAYEMVGQTAHEWIGIGMAVLFFLHHILNRKWWGNIGKGKYTPFRIAQTVLVFFVLLTMIGSMVSGVILSRHVLAFLPVQGGRSLGRNLHMLSAYWGFILMSLHLGFHWNMMMGMVGKFVKRTSAARTWSLRGLALAIAAYGVYAFEKRGTGSYLFLKIQFVFFDFEEPLLFFVLDYMAIMGLFLCIGHYLAAGLKKIRKKS
ncbi:MAG TPA: hypothetical protein DD414_03110 [Lachnospiraceae bacterium]|nr:hypothetical protein [Lachnospiraceae bacterium]